jgi:hypothetical protein
VTGILEADADQSPSVVVTPPTVELSSRRIPWLPIMALGSGISAVVMALAVFPYGSVNDDEAIYRAQAHALAGGHLFPAAPNPGIAFRPWLAALVRHHYVLKYTPVEAVVLAAGHLLTGSYVPALAATAMAVVVATWLLASELLSDRREVIIATALVAGSPLVIIQSGLLLGYLTTLVLLELFAWALVRGVRRGAGRWLVAAGLALGVATAFRTYDAIIFAAPFLVWAAVALGGRVARPIGWFVAGGLGPLAAFLAYNDMATGSPFKLPFSLQETHDTLGFGLRRLNPTEDFHHFGPIQGLAGVGAHLLLLVIWVAGGPILIGLAAVAVRRGQLRGPALALAVTAITVPAGYLIFWGPWNAFNIWGGVQLVGPFYMLPLVPVAAVLGARGMTIIGRRHPGWTRIGIAAMAVVTVAVSAPAVAADARYSRQDGQVAALAKTAPGPALVVLPPKPGFVMFPHWNLGNMGGLDGPVVYAAATGTAADFDLLDRFRDRVPYFMTFSGAFLPHQSHAGAQLNRLIEVHGPAIDLRAQAALQKLRNKKLALTVTAGGPVRSCGPPDLAGGWSIHIAPTGDVTCTGSGAAVTSKAGSPGSIKLKYSAQSGFKDEVDIPERADGKNATVLVSGPIAALLRHVTLPLTVTASS